MKTRQEYFAAARQRFIDENPNLVRTIERDATSHAHHIGMSVDELCQEQITEAFVKNLRALGDNNVVTVLNMMEPDSEIRRAVLTQYYEEIANGMGMHLSDFLIENNISL
ncbi:DUF6388 family protein [Serratia fonticola]|uniref:DUF6388 family protein n=1 Tax=Serratia fonticola TaxID=47917 RepID=UPI003987EB90